MEVESQLSKGEISQDSPLDEKDVDPSNSEQVKKPSGEEKGVKGHCILARGVDTYI